MSNTEAALYDPIDMLKPVDENIWVVDGPIVRMAALGISFPFPTRMTVIRLDNGDLWCHLPTQLTPTLKSELERLGPVRHLVSPNKLHYACISAWSSAYPEAITWASPGVRKRAARQKIDVTFARDLADQPPPDWNKDIDQLIFHGSRALEEVVFFHHKSGTLVLADLIENCEPSKLPKKLRELAKLSGCIEPNGKAPLDLSLMLWGQKARARACFERMLSWNINTVILAHSRWYKDNCPVELRRAFRWLE